MLLTHLVNYIPDKSTLKDYGLVSQKYSWFLPIADLSSFRIHSSTYCLSSVRLAVKVFFLALICTEPKSFPRNRTFDNTEPPYGLNHFDRDKYHRNAVTVQLEQS